MGVLVAVDPGLRGCGVAVFRDGVLVDASYVRSACLKERGPVAWRLMVAALAAHVESVAPDATELVVELPQVYPQGRYRKNVPFANPADLIELAAVVGGVATSSNATLAFALLPREWTGGVPKGERNTATEGQLAPEELAAYRPCVKSLRHNVTDAVGLGLHYLGR